jgi:hypothetical protein
MYLKYLPLHNFTVNHVPSALISPQPVSAFLSSLPTDAGSGFNKPTLQKHGFRCGALLGAFKLKTDAPKPN